MKHLILLTIALLSPMLYGSSDFLGNYIEKESLKSGSLDYIAPNEVNPALALPIYKKAPRGLYISVGTERGFIGASNSQNITHLLLLDNNPRISYFNMINISLLKLAKNREDYLYLRLKARHEEWILRQQKSKVEDTFLQLSDFDWWFNNVRGDNVFGADSFKLFHTRFEVSNLQAVYTPFDEVNYLFYDKQFEKISKMAKEGKISVLVGDLSNRELAEAIVKKMRIKHIKLSFFDVSNSWWPRYSDSKKISDSLMSYKRVAHPMAILLTTSDGNYFRGNVDYRGDYLSQIEDATELENRFLHWYHNDFIPGFPPPDFSCSHLFSSILFK